MALAGVEAAGTPLVNALIDTGLMLDYLQGEPRAAEAFAGCASRSITALTWLEVMRRCPPDRREATRAFLRGFERLSISESTADEAMRLSFARDGLPLERAVNWASAIANQLVFVTTDAQGVREAERNVVVPYVARHKR